MEVKALRERPELNEEFLWLYEAYLILSKSRQCGGMGEFYIPLTEYEAYLNIIRLEDIDQRTFLVSVISQVDSILLHERFEKSTKR